MDLITWNCLTGGDIRPYFTVHNQDFKYFSQMGGHQGFTSAIVGVTNPFFIKAYENVSHKLLLIRFTHFV